MCKRGEKLGAEEGSALQLSAQGQHNEEPLMWPQKPPGMVAEDGAVTRDPSVLGETLTLLPRGGLITAARRAFDVGASCRYLQEEMAPRRPAV